MELINIDQLSVSNQNIRKDTLTNIGDNESSISELAASIQEHGLLNPISVRKIDDNQFDIFAGQRRFLAMRQLGWTKIPCIISNIDDNVAKTRSLVENFHRQDNSYEEKVKAFTELYEKCCQNDINKLSKLVGLKQSTIKRYLRLSTLPVEILSHLDTHEGEKRLTLKNADDLVGIEKNKAVILTEKMLENNLSTNQIKDTINKFKIINDIEQVDDIIDSVIADVAISKKLLAPAYPWFYNPDDPDKEPIIISSEMMKSFYQLYQTLISK